MSEVFPGTPEPAGGVSRRNVLKALTGGAAFAVTPSLLLAACGSSGGTSSSGSTAAAAGSATGTVTFGSNYSDPVPKAAFAAMIDGFHAKNSGATVKINTVDHNTFQNNISNYLQGTPDDLFTWFAGFRMRYFAKQGLATPIDDVWSTIGANFSDAFKTASKGDDGHYYFVPLYNYPWAVFYRKSVWAAKGYQVPANWDDFVALQKKMKSDGLVPMAMGQKDGWPALGTFDIINMRLNGYQFHMDLMAHKVALGRPQGARRLQAVAGGPALPAGRAPTAGSGRTPPRRCSTSRPACTCSGRSWPSSSPVPTSPTWRSSLTRRSTRPTARTRSTRRSTAS